MRRTLDSRLSRLNEQLIVMAGYLEQALESATAGWRTRSLSKVREVYEIESRVNTAHVAVDACCVQLLALQQPLAADLRVVVAAIKINSDLERMVDLAVNIANNTEYYLKAPQQLEITNLSSMSDEVCAMVRQVLDAFVHLDDKLARDVVKHDDKVDAFKRKIVDDILSAMKEDPSASDQGLNIIFMAKNLERIGDHATNIAEDVIFASSGEDIRHSGKPGHLRPARESDVSK